MVLDITDRHGRVGEGRFSQRCQYQFEKLTNYYSMIAQRATAPHPPPPFLFTIRFQNHRPLLVHSASAKSTLALSSSPASRPITPLPNNYPPHPSQGLSSTILSFSPHPPALHSASLPASISKSCLAAAQQGRCKEEEARQERITLDESLIDELLSLDEIATPAPGGQRVGLQQLHIQETESVHLDASTLTDDQYSEILPLTEEEREFFTNFVRGSRRLSDSVFKFVEIQEQDCRKVQLQERKKVIRNFFRPKSSFMKDDRTCCNSSNNLESLMESYKGSSPDRQGPPLDCRRMLHKQASFNN